MSRAYDFTVSGVITIIAVVIHLISVELFSPGKPLHKVASTGTATLNGAARADLWFQILTIWLPLMMIGGIMSWALVREYRRTVNTSARPSR
jgi:hypothetical protein